MTAYGVCVRFDDVLHITLHKSSKNASRGFKTPKIGKTKNKEIAMTNQVNLFPTKKEIIQELKQETRTKAAEKGCECPVCGQNVKIYKRKINSILAKQLLLAFKKHGLEWFHIRDMEYFTTDWAVLQHFNLIFPKPHNIGDGGKKTSGYWRITKNGRLFCLRDHFVFSHALIFNNTRLDFAGKLVTIDDCLGEKFDYKELMEG